MTWSRKRCGGSSRPPWTSGRSGEAQNRRERPVLWELGLIRLARWGKRGRKGSCLGGRCGWCELRCRGWGAFYRPERGGAAVYRGGSNARATAGRGWEVGNGARVAAAEHGGGFQVSWERTLVARTGSIDRWRAAAKKFLSPAMLLQFVTPEFPEIQSACYVFHHNPRIIVVIHIT
jgi:hypothetical protein